MFERHHTALRRLYFAIGAFSAAYFFLMGVVGVLLRHAKLLRLANIHIGRTFLPEAYRQGETVVRADDLLSDVLFALHWGRIGGFILDVLVIFWSTTILVALVLLFWYRSRSLQLVPEDRPTAPPSQPMRSVVGGPSNPGHSAKVLQFRKR